MAVWYYYVFGDIQINFPHLQPNKKVYVTNE